MNIQSPYRTSTIPKTTQKTTPVQTLKKDEKKVFDNLQDKRKNFKQKLKLENLVGTADN